MRTRSIPARMRLRMMAAILGIALAPPAAWTQGKKDAHEMGGMNHAAMKSDMKGDKEADAKGEMPMANEGGAKVKRSDAYPLSTCIVSGKELGTNGSPVVKTYDGREVRFCCGDCPAKFEADKAAYLKKLDDAIIARQKGAYPLDTCVVSGEKLGGDMGAPVNYVYKNRLVEFCCKDCVKDFTKDPEKYLTKLDNAVVEKQAKDYPLDTCVVSGDKLGGDMGAPVDYVYDGQLVRFCCKDCVKPFEKDPAKYMAKIADAAKGKAAGGKAMDATSPDKKMDGQMGKEKNSAGPQM